LLTFTKMKKNILKEIEIPEKVEVKLEENKLIVKGPEGENSKELKLRKLNFEIKDKKIFLGHKKATKTEKKMINTIEAHIKNMLKGVLEKFEYKLKICFGHFPFTVKIENNEAIVKNFLGEKIDRKVKLPKDAEISIDKEIITIISTNKEIAGQAAANFEAVTKIRGRDKRIFQDGIYIINKCGKKI